MPSTGGAASPQEAATGVSKGWSITDAILPMPLALVGRIGIKMYNNNLLERIFRTGDGVFAVDEKQRIIFWNHGAEQVLGYVSEDVMGRHCFEVIQGVDESGKASCAQDCPIIDCARQGRLGPGQNLQVKTKDGSLRWLSITHTLMDPFNEHPAVMVHVFRDATSEVEAKRLVGRIAEQLSGYALV